MNHVYRIIWNETLGTWVAVAENVKRKGKRSGKALKMVTLVVTGAVSGNLYASSAQCVPAGNCVATDSGFTQTITLTNNVSTAIGAKISGSDGKNGRAGALFVPPKAGGKGETIEGASYIQWGDAEYDPITTTTTIKYIKTNANSIAPAEYKVVTFTPKNDKTSGEEGYDSLFGDTPPMMNVTTTTYTLNASASYDKSNPITSHIVADVSINEKTGDVKITPQGYNFTITDNLYTSGSGSAESGTALQVQDASGQPIPFKTIVKGENKTVTLKDSGVGVYSITEGGEGGNGGSYYLGGKGKAGGKGGDASDTQLDVSDLNIVIHAAKPNDAQGSVGVFVKSQGGDGGNGGGSYTISANGGSGSLGGIGKDATVNVFNTDINIQDDYSSGIAAISVAGDGGNGGKAGGIVSSGGKGNSAGQAGSVSITTDSKTIIAVNGKYSSGILAQSIGGAGGKSGNSIGLVGLGGQGGHGGNAGKSTVNNYAQINMTGELSNAITAQSLGGGGGNGGFSAALVALGAKGGAGGNGDKVAVTNGGKLTTNGYRSAGILAQSIGGGGGNAGLTVGLVSIGGDGSGGGTGGGVEVSTTKDSNIITQGDESVGIHAQSIGGGGGNGGLTVGAIAIGADGGAGNSASEVTVTNKGDITTKGNKGSSAILAQSIGGGGGNGSMSVAAGGLVSVAIGGKGADGGDGGEVTVSSAKDRTIQTKGEDSSAIVAQSIGGGGGNGGIAIATSASIGSPITASVVLGGKGGNGAKSNHVIVGNDSNLSTEGNRSTGITAQSIGGGGGNGGIAVAASAGLSIVNVNVALGGNGGNGGEAKTATVNNSGNISTKGIASTGILAQSIGGGGGSGGITVSGSLGPSLFSANIALGGAGGKGNAASQAFITNKGNIITKGASSSAIVSQSIGGAGGNAGGSVAASVGSANAVNLAIGGSGGEGGKAGLAKVENEAEYIGTAGDNSSAIIAQSIGGDGGNGGFAGAADIFGGNAVGLSFGGAGSKGAEANKAIVNSTGSIETAGNNSVAIVAQSIGGTGGNGGLALAVKAAGSGQLAANIALGGQGGEGGKSNEVAITAKKSKNSDANTASMLTEGNNATGILAQSIAGSGGSGGFSVAGTALTGSGMSVGVALGGNAGQGAKAEKVHVTTDHNIVTTGDSSAAIVAQSVGGDGGSGGFAVSAGADIKAVTANVTLGGTGGTGGTSQSVLVNLKSPEAKSPSSIHTRGNHATGALAQSIGGSGGNGGFSVAAGLNANLFGGATASVALGGSGGKGGTANSATINSDQIIITEGDFSSALQAQSIGGSGGNGGFAVAAALAGSIKMPSAAFSVALGGKGGKGGTAGAASVTSTGFIETSGDYSNGIIAQSLGGSGGTGGFSGALSGSLSPKGAISASVAVGGSGGTGGKAGIVDVTVDDDIITHGTSSSGIVAQSIGGSGGAGGLAVSGAFTVAATGPAIALDSSIGGAGGLGSQAKLVQVNNAGNISTEGDYAYGILAQSINGNGGSGGIAANLSGAFSQGTAIGASVTIGGKGGGVSSANAQNIKDDKGATIGNIDEFGTLTYGGVARDADGYRINDNGQRVNSNNLTISAVTAANSSIVTGFGAGLDDYGYRVDANGRYLLDSNGEKILAVGYQTNENGHFSVMNSSEFVDNNGYRRNVAGNFLANKSGILVEVDSSGYLVSDTDRKGTQFTLLKNPNAQLVLTRIDGMYSTSEQKSWNDFLAKITYTDAVRAKNNVIVKNISKDGKPKSITTEGYGADGILAQSIGGNGGAGGMSISGAIAGSTDGAAINAAVAVGGSGGKGGISGDVTVENTNFSIGTKGDSASAIRAQSIGGGGGKGGLSIAAGVSGSAQTAVSLTASVGGGGGSGNVAGNVNVTSTNDIKAVDDKGNLLTTISTQGNSSHGIAAESIGGGGGDGGFSGSFAVSGSLNKSAPAVALSIGGQAGNGNRSGDVTVKSVDNIWTEGVGSSGILAKSIAGGGGDGGFGLSVSASANLTQDKNALGASIAVGGFGGSGNAAGKVNVDSEGFIKSKGDYSNGVLAQSIGGGGGNGGMAVAVNAMLAQNGMGLSASVGGWGGSGGTGGTVDVLRMGNIHTEGNRAAGILAQSIGGGGGNGGNSYSGSVFLDGVKGTDKTTNFTASVGGFGGSGNTSDIVTVNNIGNIYTLGMLSSAIQAQSIGGGGGNGGNASTTTLKLECGDLCKPDNSGNTNTSSGTNNSGATPAPVTKKDTNLSFSVGGWGGTGNDADDVNVISSGLLATSGLGSHGIYAQSIGGGGGDGGSSVVESKKFNLSDVELVNNKLTFALGVGDIKVRPENLAMYMLNIRV